MPLTSCSRRLTSSTVFLTCLNTRAARHCLLESLSPTPDPLPAAQCLQKEAGAVSHFPWLGKEEEANWGRNRSAGAESYFGQGDPELPWGPGCWVVTRKAERPQMERKAGQGCPGSCGQLSCTRTSSCP